MKSPLVVFLDIDGPVIGNPQVMIDHMASYSRSVMNTNAIGYINQICHITGAKLVTNSMHNNHVTPRGHDLKTDLVLNGVRERFFHEDWRTEFPSRCSRRDGVLKFVEKHNIEKYVGFDDYILPDDNFIQVEMNDGITYTHYVAAMKLLLGEKTYKQALANGLT